ncbi:hypothetical protein STEG23_029386, partial [Scotinomys teguina]
NKAQFLKAHSSIDIIYGVEVDPVSYVVESQGQGARVEEPLAPCIRWVDPSVEGFWDEVLQSLIPMRPSIVDHVTYKQIFGFVLGLYLSQQISIWLTDTIQASAADYNMLQITASPGLAIRFVVVKEWICRLTGFLCSLLSLEFGIILISSRYWRLWEFDDKVVRLVYIGLWKAYYHQEFNISGSVTRVLVNSPVNSNWTISPEFRYAQDLILLSILIKPAVLVFSSVAIRISIIKASVPDIQTLCYKCSVLILVFSSLCTILSVTWNQAEDLYGETTLDFPPTFPVKKEALIKKHHTHVFPMGMLTATLSLLGMIMFLFEIRLRQDLAVGRGLQNLILRGIRKSVPGSQTINKALNVEYLSKLYKVCHIQHDSRHGPDCCDKAMKKKRTWKQPRCPSTEEWIRKMWYIYTMEYYTAEKNNDIMKFAGKWMDLENVILSESFQSDNVLAFISNITQSEGLNTWKEEEAVVAEQGLCKFPKSNNDRDCSSHPQKAGDQYQVLSNSNVQWNEGVMVDPEKLIG